MSIKEEWEAEKESFGSLVESIASGTWDEDVPEPIEEDPEPEPQSDGDVIFEPEDKQGSIAGGSVGMLEGFIRPYNRVRFSNLQLSCVLETEYTPDQEA